MNNLDLVTYAKKALSERWGYVWGTFGQVLTQDLLNQKLRQYPDSVGNYLDFIKANWMGRRVTDCVGLIKGCYWNGSYNAATDVSADGMYQRAKEKGLVSTMPDIPGVCVHKEGHIGVYIGNGQIIEAHGTKYGVIQTPLVGGTPWTHWLKCPFVDYNTQLIEQSKPKPQQQIIPKVLAYQIAFNKMGLGKILEDGIWGNQTLNSVSKLPLLKIGSRNAMVGWLQGVLGCGQDNIFGNITNAKLRAYQAKNNLIVDGIAGQQTIKYILTS